MKNFTKKLITFMSFALLAANTTYAGSELSAGKLIHFTGNSFGIIESVNADGVIFFYLAKPILSDERQLTWKKDNRLSQMSGIFVSPEAMTAHQNNCAVIKQSEVSAFYTCAGMPLRLQGRNIEILKIFTDGTVLFDENGSISAGSDLGFSLIQ